jgi:molybdenum cofactor guanylyltransferase
MKRSTISAIVLAGGHSRRMGQDKALIPINGVPCLRRVCDVAFNLSDSIYVVTAWIDRYREILSSDYHLVIDRATQGPLVGFLQGLQAIQTEWVLLLACDLPKLQPAALQTWAAQLETLSAETIALLPRHAKGWEPLCGFYRRRCRNELQSAIDQGMRSFQPWLATQIVAELTVTDTDLLFNCNTPEDLSHIR